MLVLYGLGTTVGGGIYVLVGAVAGRAGLYAPVSFLLAAVLTAFTALSFAELSARFPLSAGEAVYVEEGLRSKALAQLVGYLVVASGIVSTAALTIGFSGYFRTLVPVPDWAAVVGIVILLGLLAAWGIGESVSAAAIVTIVEIGGLLIIVWVGRGELATFPVRLPDLLPPLHIAVWAGILGGSFLAYYAFIGFEDMVNVAEEVKDVRRVLPISIVITLVLTTLLYGAIAIVAVLAVPIGDLAASEAPLALIFEHNTGRPATAITVISVAAVLNGALIQIIMAARVLYGMSQRGWLPSSIGRIHHRTRTPVTATALVVGAVVILALGFQIQTLAQVTTIGIVAVAILVNAALVRLKWRTPSPLGEQLIIPMWVPVAGVVVSVFFVVLALADLAARG